jgi:predicted dienelactone hydrolase
MNVSRLLAGLLALASFASIAHANAKPIPQSVGMEEASAPVANDMPVSVTIWYPSTSVARPQAFGPYQFTVAMAGAPVAQRLPLIVMSHGTGGAAFSSAELAINLAKAGFVVAAVEHSGDNYRDRSRSFSRTNFVSRPHQISATINFLTGSWHNKSMIDSARIGMFGHSAGGNTTLIIGGGVLDWRQVIEFCLTHPDDWGCRGSRSQGSEGQSPAFNQANVEPTPISAADPRVKALVVAAPALLHGFAPTGLVNLKLPVQLWVAGRDAIVPDAGAVAQLMSIKPEQHDIANAGHFSFYAPCSDMLRGMAPEICSDPKGFDRARFQKMFTSEVVRFYRAHLTK